MATPPFSYVYELYLGGSWVDITTLVRHSQGVKIKRGTDSDAPKLTPSTATLTLENADDRFNPRNPLGPYFGQLVRNTPIRIADRVYPTVKGLWTSPALSGGASTPDSVALSITGDLDLRAEVPVYKSDYYWVTKSGSYALRSSGGFLQLQWVRTSATLTRTSTAAIPAGHTAFRATLDVDNGASGHTVTFYTAVNWGDPWVQLGSTVVTAGTTAIDDSTGSAFLGGTTTDVGPLCVRRAEIRSGIGGTLVASPNPSGQADGTTSWADAQGNTWLVINVSRIGSGTPWYAFYGEVFAFEPQWNENRTNCTVPVKANGVLRRLLKNKTYPKSYYRSWTNAQTSNPKPLHYWPLEESSDAGAALPDIGQNTATLALADPRFVVPNNGAVWGAAQFNDWIPNGAAIPNLWQLRFPCDMRASTSPSWMLTCLLTFPANESIAVVEIDVGVGIYTISIYNTSPDWLTSQVLVIDPAGGITITTNSQGNLRDAGPLWFTFRSNFTGSAIQNRIGIGAITPNTLDFTAMGSFSAAAHRYPREVRISSSNNTATPATNVKNYLGLKDVSVSEHGTFDSVVSYQATQGIPGEVTYARFSRLLTGLGINSTTSVNGSIYMGRQYVQSLEDHLDEILVSSEHSGIFEDRTANQLRLAGQGTHRGSINYTAIRPDLRPVEDDNNTANIVNVVNSHSGSVTLTKATGDLSVAQVGPFEDKLETNTDKLQYAVSVGGKRLALGTWPGPRFEEITVSARSNPENYDLYRAIDVGDYFDLTGMQAAGYYDALVLKVTSISEMLTSTDHVFTFTVRPGEIDYRRWQVGTNRIDLASSTVAVASSGSTMDVNVPNAKWLNSAAPFDVMISGERMTVTGVTDLTSTTQRLAVTRAVNGVAKTVPVGAEVHIYPAFFIKAV